MAAGFERWNREVIDTVPSDRLLVWDPKDGWEPLCELLEVPVPDAPLPNVNDTENSQKNLIMGPALEAINAWWEDKSRVPKTRPRCVRRPRRNRRSRSPAPATAYIGST